MAKNKISLFKYFFIILFLYIFFIFFTSMDERYYYINLKSTLIGHTAIVKDIDIKKQKIISCSEDRTIRLWNINGNDNEVIKRLDFKPDCIVFSNDGKFVACGGGSTVLVWNLELQKDHLNLTDNIESVSCLLFTENNSKIISGSQSGKIVIWNLVKKERKVLSLHTSDITCLIISGSTLISGGADGIVGIWDLETEYLIESFSDLNEPIKSLHFVDTNKKIWVGCTEKGTLFLGDTEMLSGKTGVDYICGNDEYTILFNFSKSDMLILPNIYFSSIVNLFDTIPKNTQESEKTTEKEFDTDKKYFFKKNKNFEDVFFAKDNIVTVSNKYIYVWNFKPIFDFYDIKKQQQKEEIKKKIEKDIPKVINKEKYRVFWNKIYMLLVGILLILGILLLPVKSNIKSALVGAISVILAALIAAI